MNTDVSYDNHVEVFGAYGRSYQTLREMAADWVAGKDFRISTGRYINKRDAERYNVGVVGRYGPGATKLGRLR